MSNKKKVVEAPVSEALSRLNEEPEVLEAQEKLEEASSPLNAPTLQLKRRGRVSTGQAQRRCLIFIPQSDFERIMKDGRPISMIGRLAIKEWLDRNQQ